MRQTIAQPANDKDNSSLSEDKKEMPITKIRLVKDNRKILINKNMKFLR
jgi:hypothetical protein